MDQSFFSEEKKKGIRDCRKWMYRNCSKSGLFNETGTKRNYIDTFCKQPVGVQANTLYQIESGLYRFDDDTETMERAAMSNNYRLLIFRPSDFVPC